MSWMSSSHAVSLSMPLLTTSLPTYRSIFPGAPPTYPKSASAISPGPFTMHPMTAMATPGRWPVRSEMAAVTSCRSNSVRPHEGHETYSVFVLRMREPCSRPNDVRRRYSRSAPGCSIMTPSPRPSHSSPPACAPD